MDKKHQDWTAKEWENLLKIMQIFFRLIFTD